jgi:hypothetical protein
VVIGPTGAGVAGEPDGRGVRCALEGCDVLVARQVRGGRPKLYCSDAHRSLARRRRMRSGSSGPDDLAIQALSALRHAAVLVEEALVAPAARLEAELADTRARATAEVLDAQRRTADATRQLVALRTRLDEERARAEVVEEAARAREAGDKVVIDELRAALEGARAELEDELLRHHRDVQALQEERSRRGTD